MRRAHPEHGALSSIQASYSLFAAGMVPYPDLDAPTRAQVQAVKAALAPWAAEQMYSNFAETQCDPASFWGEDAYSRLRRVKAAVDPDDLIRANHRIIGRSEQ